MTDEAQPLDAEVEAAWREYDEDIECGIAALRNGRPDDAAAWRAKALLARKAVERASRLASQGEHERPLQADDDSDAAWERRRVNHLVEARDKIGFRYGWLQARHEAGEHERPLRDQRAWFMPPDLIDGEAWTREVAVVELGNPRSPYWHIICPQASTLYRADDRYPLRGNGSDDCSMAACEWDKPHAWAKTIIDARRKELAAQPESSTERGKA